MAASQTQETPLTAEEDFRRALRMADRNGDGFLSTEEAVVGFALPVELHLYLQREESRVNPPVRFNMPAFNVETGGRAQDLLVLGNLRPFSVENRVLFNEESLDSRALDERTVRRIRNEELPLGISEIRISDIIERDPDYSATPLPSGKLLVSRKGPEI